MGPGSRPGRQGEIIVLSPHAIRCMPASIRTNSPVILLDCGVARKHTSAAISSADDATLSGTLATTLSRTCLAPSSPRPLVNQGVSIYPGHTGLTRIKGASARASDSVMVLSAPLLAT